MSIQSTSTVSRDYAIRRIKKVIELVQERNYRTLELTTHERDDMSHRDFVNETLAWLEKNKEEAARIDNWSNQMLEDKLDEPFFRKTIFDNYFVSDDVEE